MGADPCPLDTPVIRRGTDGVVDVDVPTLAWATIASLRAVLRDPAQATAAERLAGQLLAG